MKLDTVADVLAAKRLTRLIVEDTITEPVREAVWKIFPAESTKIGYLFTCKACTSVWTSALVRSGILPSWVRDTLAISETVLLADRIVEDRVI